MSALDKIRQAFPDLQNASDSDLLGEISKLTGRPYESTATMLGVAPRGTASEVARQIGAGFAVDLPKMVGQGLQYTGVAPEAGRSLVESAKERAYGWTPDLRGRGLVGEALVTGGRAIGPMAPAIAASLVPGGQFAAPAVAAGLFGTSSAQETYEKLIGQGIPEQDAISAARRVGLVQGPLEGVATAAGLGAFRAAKPLVGLGGTTAGLAAKMTDTSVLKPFAKGMATNLVVQPSTEVAQDVGTEMIERAYGAAPEDIGAIARSSALGGVGLTLLLGPLAIGGHVARANRAEKLKEALYSPDTPTEIRAQALDLVMGEARRQNIPEANVDQWFEQQLTMEDARNAELAKLEEEQKAGERDLLVTEEKPIQQRIDQNLGLTRKEDRKGYEKQFEEAFTEGTGQRVADAVTGVERELTAGELVQRDLPQDLTVATTEETKPTAPPIFSELDTELNKQGIKPTKTSRNIYQYMVAEGIDPASREAQDVLNALAASKMGEARKSISEIIRARSPRVSTAVPSVQQPAGGVGVGGVVVPGVVGNAGPAAPVAGTMVRSPAVAGRALQQTGILPSTTGQPTTPVTTGAPSGTQAPQTVQAAPQGQAPTTRGAAGTTALVDTSDDALEIAKATGNAAEIEVMREEETGLRRDQTDFTADDLEAVIEQHLSKSEDKERDRQILNAYITARRSVPEGYKGSIAKEIAASFGIAESRVRQIGNPELLANIATSMGFDRSQLFDSLGIQSAKKAAATELGKLEGELSRLESKAKPTQADIDRMSELSEQIDRVKGNIQSGDLATALKVMGFEGEAGESFSTMDDSRDWQKASTAGSQVAVDLVAIADSIDALRAAAEELQQLNLPQAAAAANQQIETLTAKYEALVAGVTAPKAERKKTKAKAKTEVAQVAAEEKDAAKEAEAAKFRAERAAKLEADRKGLAVGDTVMNPKLGTGVVKSFAGDGDATTVTVAFQSGQTKELSVKLAKLEKTNAVQVQSTAVVPVQPKTETGQGVGSKVRRAPKPAAEVKAPTQILTEAEQAAQAWDVVAADFPQAPKFADLTKAQQENFIEFGPDNWTKADVETELTRLARTAAPKFNALRTVNTVDADNVSIKLQEQELSRLEKVPGVAAATARLISEGLGDLVDYVGGWYTTDSQVDWDGGFTAIDGQAAVLLRRGVLTDSQRTEWTVYHEIGHAADQTHLEGGGVFSSLPGFNLSVSGGKILPMGRMAKQLFEHYNNEPTSDLSKHLSYPFDRKQHGDLNADGIREELFAQLWATYATFDGREFLEDNLPDVADFMEQVYEEVRQTDYAAATANETQRSAQAVGQAPQGNGQSGQVPLRQTAVRFRALRKAQAASAVAKLPKQAQQPVNNSINTISDWARQGLDRLVFTSDLINRAVDAGIKSAKTFEGLLAKRDTKARSLEREVERIADTYAGIEEANKGDGPNSVNQFIFESTRTGKWGYDSGSFKADPKMAAQFNALGPKAQAYAKSIFTHGNKMLSDKKKAVIDYATSEYDARIAAETDPVKKAALTKDKVNDLKKFASLFKIREGIPYAPIKRFGDHVVVAKSKAYMDAVAAKDTKLVSQLEKDPDHYHVSFMETKNEARNLAAQLEDQGFFSGGTVAFKERSVADKELFGNSDSLGAITRLRAMADAKANAGDKGAAQMQRMVSDLYLQALAEGSARKSEMRRRGVSGEIDMLRSFAAQGRADANFVASVEYNPQVQDAIQTMRTEANQGSGDLNRKSEILNEVTRRYESSLDVTPTPTINKITRLSSIYYLATSPAYYMQNLTQPWMMSVPAMAGRHDYAKSSAALFTAYGQLGGVMKSARYDRQFDFSKVPGDVQAAIQELANRGKIDIGLETELGEFKIEGDGAFSKGWNKVDKFLRIAVQKVESINRLSTAMAAYRLELAKTGDKEAAINYADRILTETHGDYSSFNAPRFFNNPIGKVALQFRKFQLIQLTYYAKLLKDSGLDTKEKRAATKALVYSLGHTALLAGAMGLPGYSAIAWAIGALFGDDDDPLDVTAELRKFIGDEDMANLIMRGAPTLAGVDISGKVGAGNALSIMPFSRADLTTKAGVIEAAGTLLGGAPVGMAARVADGLGQMMSGEWYKGMEQVLPKGLGDAAKAYRISTEGMSRRNGDIVLPASEVSAWEALVQSMGIQPAQQSVVMERQQNTLEMNQFYQDRSTKVKAQYIKAIRAGESTAEARDAWNKLQEARVENGYTRQPLSELLKSPQSQAKREKQVVDGVQFNKANKRFVEEQV